MGPLHRSGHTAWTAPEGLGCCWLPLTLECRILDFLLDVGHLNHVGGFLGEEELPRASLEAGPVVFEHRDAVLQGDTCHTALARDREHAGTPTGQKHRGSRRPEA